MRRQLYWYLAQHKWARRLMTLSVVIIVMALSILMAWIAGTHNVTGP